MGVTKQPETAADKLFDEIVDYFTRVEKKTIHMVNRELVDKSVLNQMVVKYLADKQLKEEQIEEMVKMFDAYVFGYHILEPLVNDDMISDIKIIRYDIVRIKKNGKRMTSDIRFKDNGDSYLHIRKVSKVKRGMDYFIIGEIKGGEALYFLNAAYTGHQCWASVHGVSSTEAIDKLADL